MTVTIPPLSARAFIEHHESRRQVNRILHGFPSPRFWTAGAVSASDALANRAARPTGEALQLYVGVPFCIRTDPDRCGYCLFPVEIFEGAHQLDVYLDHLEREGELFAPLVAGSELSSVYIGGGTPNLMRSDQAARMLGLIHGMFPSLTKATSLTFEGIPQLFSREKLAGLAAAGVTRISMGVQQVNTELNRLSGRRQTSEHVFNAIGWCHELGLECNVDLIFGWPRQTMDTMLSDLARVVESGVDHVAHYELNIGGPSDFSLNRRDELPSPQLTREMYRASRDFLVSHGYRQLTAYDYQRAKNQRETDQQFVYEECSRSFGRRETWGWGFAGVTDVIRESDGASCTYLNHRSVPAYYDDVDAGTYPVELGFVRSDQDRRLHALFRNLQGMSVDRTGYRYAFGLDVVDEFAECWDAIVDRGWAQITADEIQLCGDGVYHTPLIQALLSRNRVDELCEAALVAVDGTS